MLLYQCLSFICHTLEGLYTHAHTHKCVRTRKDIYLLHSNKLIEVLISIGHFFGRAMKEGDGGEKSHFIHNYNETIYY